MKLSKQTLDLFKNFGSINSNLFIKKGNNIATISASKDIYAEATFEETFQKQAGLYNVYEFLSVIGLFNDPDFVFDDSFVTVTEGKKKIKYVYAEPDLLTYPDKKITMPSVEGTFEITADQLDDMRKASNALRAPDLVITSNGKGITLRVCDVKNTTSSAFEIQIDDASGDEFTVYLRMEKFKFLPGGYTISLSHKKVAKFDHKEIKLTYFLSVEKDTTFGRK